MPAQVRANLLPGLGLIVVALLALALGYLSEGSSRDASRPDATGSQASAVRGVVQEVSGDRITLTTGSGPVNVRVTSNTVFETLGTTTRMHLAVGKDWLNVGALQHPQTLLAINGLVVISEGGPP